MQYSNSLSSGSLSLTITRLKKPFHGNIKQLKTVSGFKSASARQSLDFAQMGSL